MAIVTSPMDVQTALQIADSATGKSVLSIIEAKMLRALRHNNLGIYLTANAMNPGELVPGGTALFRRGVMMSVTNYDATGANKQTPNVQTLSVKLDQSKEIIYEVESIDLARYFKIYNTNEEIANAILATFNETSINSIKAHLDCVFFKQLVTAAGATQVVDVVELGKLDGTVTRDKAVAAYGEYAPAAVALEKSITKFNLGVNRAELFGVFDPIAIEKLALASATLYGATANDANLIEERLGVKASEVGDYGGRMGAIDLFRTPLLNRKLTHNVDQYFTSDDFDFTNVVGIIFQREAVALPMSIMQSEVNKNYNNGNFVFLHKFNYGVDTIRGELVRVFKEKTTP